MKITQTLGQMVTFVDEIVLLVQPEESKENVEKILDQAICEFFI